MHYGICAIVYAHDEAGALEQADKAFRLNSCKECGRAFDYFNIRPQDGFKSAAVKASTKAGQTLVAHKMELTKANFIRQLQLLREALAKYDNEAAYNQRFPKIEEDIRFLAHDIGRYGGPDVYLYDNDGEGIREPHHLKSALEKWPTLKDHATRSKLDNAGEVWVVMADAHS